MIYERSQSNGFWVALGLALSAMSVGLAFLVASDSQTPPIALVAALGPLLATVALIGGSRLDVAISATEVHLRWRFGWPHKTIARSDISGVEPLRFPWWYGWGIRKVPGGWMWNIKGRDAVALTLASGRRFLIGTDDPDGLVAAL